MLAVDWRTDDGLASSYVATQSLLYNRWALEV